LQTGNLLPQSHNCAEPKINETSGESYGEETASNSVYTPIVLEREREHEVNHARVRWETRN
jgi:hypothetical protein